MDAILSKLKSKAEIAPDNALLRDTISLLTDLYRNEAVAQRITWDSLIRDFQRLQDEGLWDISEDNTKLLHTLRSFVTTQPSNELDRRPASSIPGHSPAGRASQGSFSIVYPDSKSAPSPLIPTSVSVMLPLELVEILNRTYFHHLLATDPKRVVPPGKSLVSMLSGLPKEGKDTAKPTLRDKVEDLVHQAFWDEAIESLSNPEPSRQLPRIKSLYQDLLVALTPLLPPQNPVITTLSSPLPPTSSPLDSTIMHLREIVASLRKRCAPVLDQELDDLLRSLDEPPPRSSRPISLATLVVDTVKSIFRISDIMKDHLSQFVLGSMTEEQLHSTVSKQAKTKERKDILDIWNCDRIERSWSIWLESYQPSFQVSGIAAELQYKWIVRLVQALGSSTPISCPLPTKTPQSIDNSLPPIFFFSTPALLEIQNYLQALVITASLRTLIRVPQGAQASDTMSFMERLWILLKAEIIEEPGSGDTKLVHLADEVVRARQLDGTVLSGEEETRLRAAAARTLNHDDPVFVLLQKRVLKALVDALGRQRSESRQAGAHTGPPRMQTGHHGKRPEKRPRMTIVLDPEDFDVDLNAEMPQLVIDRVQGFEDEYLRKVVKEVFVKVAECVSWMEGVWQDVLRAGAVDRELVI
ncbi:hypothetical protein DEU56DRAFT_32094 [Suillus clintonianus]|uniref:uncharacterized protein n=1 Tax=Suillus clintonianus TaxID=1904413 RepID=UPI001B87C2D4|nr:uncharacterized protein DEU56DRAFT_32094 [Suillus clintonianus]KAG2150493.1 hypothetical protein DEU56DRAFT_32094 [Suillus clintonianus]